MAMTEWIADHNIDRPALVAELFVLAERLRAYRRRRRQISELRSLDPRVLRDMAIDRSEVASVVNTSALERKREHAS